MGENSVCLTELSLYSDILKICVFIFWQADPPRPPPFLQYLIPCAVHPVTTLPRPWQHTRGFSRITFRRHCRSKSLAQNTFARPKFQMKSRKILELSFAAAAIAPTRSFELLQAAHKPGCPLESTLSACVCACCPNITLHQGDAAVGFHPYASHCSQAPPWLCDACVCVRMCVRAQRQMWVAACLLSQRSWGISRASSKPLHSDPAVLRLHRANAPVDRDTSPWYFLSRASASRRLQ